MGAREALAVWREVCEEAPGYLIDGAKGFLMSEAYCIRVGATLEALAASEVESAQAAEHHVLWDTFLRAFAESRAASVTLGKIGSVECALESEAKIHAVIAAVRSLAAAEVESAPQAFPNMEAAFIAWRDERKIMDGGWPDSVMHLVGMAFAGGYRAQSAEVESATTPATEAVDDLIDNIKCECTGRIEWFAMNADETAYRMCFDFKREADKWLVENPNAGRGYHIVERRTFTQAEKLVNAAAVLLADHAQPSPEVDSTAPAKAVEDDPRYHVERGNGQTTFGYSVVDTATGDRFGAWAMPEDHADEIADRLNVANFRESRLQGTSETVAWQYRRKGTDNPWSEPKLDPYAYPKEDFDMRPLGLMAPQPKEQS